MRTVMPSREVAHVWASQQQAHPRNGKGTVYFEGPTIYSYGDHWPLASFLRPDLVILNDDSYGISTSRHASYTRQALPHHIQTIAVPDCDALRAFLRDPKDPAPLLASLDRLIGRTLDSARKRIKPQLFHSDINRARGYAALYTRVAALFERPAYQLPDYVPELGPYLRAGDAPFMPDAAPIMQAFRNAHDAVRDRETFAAECAQLHNWWSERAARFDSVGYLHDCQDSRAHIDAIAKRCGLAVPRKLPSARTIGRELARAIDTATIAECSQRAAGIARQRQWVEEVHAEFRSVHTSNGVRQLPDTRLPLSRHGHSALQIVRAVHEGRWLRCVGQAEYSQDAFFNLSVPVLPDRPSPRLRETANALRAVIAAAHADLAPFYAKMDRAYKRELLQDEARTLMRRMLDPNHTEWANTRRGIDSYKLAYDVAERAGLARGLYHPDALRERCDIGQRQYEAQRAIAEREQHITTARQAVATLRDLPTHHPYKASLTLRMADLARERLAQAEPDHPLVAELAALHDAHPNVTEPSYGSPQHIEAWRAGDTGAPNPPGCIFRLVGDAIYSSQGARVSVREGRKLWALIQRCGERDFGDNGPRIGYYQLRSINPDGSVVVGCHHITAEEVRTFGAHMGWTATTVEETA